MKRPWLITPKGQRFSLHLANVLSFALFVGFALHFSLVEQPRTALPQLNPIEVNYCELTECSELFGVVLENGDTAQLEAVQESLGVKVVLRFTNTSRYQGERELWIRLESQTGELIEMASTQVAFDLKKRTSAEFLITGLKQEILDGNLLLGY